METLADIRLRQLSADIVVDGLIVSGALHIPVSSDHVLVLELRSITGDCPQGCVISCNLGTLVAPLANGKEMFVFSPKPFPGFKLGYKFPKLGERDGAKISITNVWDYGGITRQNTGNSGLLIEEVESQLPVRRWRCRCSDGIGPIDFDNLLIDLTVVETNSRVRTYGDVLEFDMGADS